MRSLVPHSNAGRKPRGHVHFTKYKRGSRSRVERGDFFVAVGSRDSNHPDIVRPGQIRQLQREKRAHVIARPGENEDWLLRGQILKNFNELLRTIRAFQNHFEAKCRWCKTAAKLHLTSAQDRAGMGRWRKQKPQPARPRICGGQARSGRESSPPPIKQNVCRYLNKDGEWETAGPSGWSSSSRVLALRLRRRAATLRFALTRRPCRARHCPCEAARHRRCR